MTHETVQHCTKGQSIEFQKPQGYPHDAAFKRDVFVALKHKQNSAVNKRGKLNGIMSANSNCGTQVSTTATKARFKELLRACIFFLCICLVNKINLCEQETVYAYGGVRATQFIQTQISRAV